MTIRHFRRACQERHDSACKTDKSSQKDRFAAVSRKENIGLIYARIGQADMADIAHQCRTAQPSSHFIADAVSQSRTQRNGHNQHIEIEYPLCCKKACHQHQAFTGNEKAKKSG